MILVLSPNLAVDHTLHVESLRPGRVHHSHDYERQAGGKGVNVARALKALGEECLLCGLAGGINGRFIETGLERESIPAALVPMKSENRICIILLSRMGEATVVNEQGPTVTEGGALRSRVMPLIAGSRAVALMGSLPPGLPQDLYAGMVTACREANVPSLVDASGPALEAALAAGPTYAKPNHLEVELLLGQEVHDWMEAAREIRKRGAKVALITRGPDDAVLSGPDLEGRLTPPAVPVVNPIGAGDALAAGLLAAHVRGKPLHEIALLGMASAAASVQHGYGRFLPDEVRPASVHLERLR